MKVLFELSGEHLSLPVSEVISSLKCKNMNFEFIDIYDGLLIVNITEEENQLENVIRRLSMSHYVDEYLLSAFPEEEILLKRIRSAVVDLGNKFRVRCENRSRKKGISPRIEKEVGSIYANYAEVNLENPDEEIRIILTDDRWFVCRKIAEIDRRQFELRKADRRPFFLPISMHPRLARTMVNLSGVKEGEVLLDPFCGTGGMLIEAGLMGIRVKGSDIQGWIAEGCKKNLQYYGIEDFEVKNIDVGEIEVFGKVDAVVTDFPYGRASTTKKEPVEKLYRRAFDAISNVLKRGRKLVCAIPSVESINIGNEYLDLIEVHPFRVHGNLTRYICVFRK